MIHVEHLSLTIRKTEILRDISAVFEKGKIHGLIGRNGSGKTMLMKCICGFVRPTAGTVTVNGKQIGKGSRERRVRHYRRVHSRTRRQ